MTRHEEIIARLWPDAGGGFLGVSSSKTPGSNYRLPLFFIVPTVYYIHLALSLLFVLLDEWLNGYTGIDPYLHPIRPVTVCYYSTCNDAAAGEVTWLVSRFSSALPSQKRWKKEANEEETKHTKLVASHRCRSEAQLTRRLLELSNPYGVIRKGLRWS